MAPGYGQRPYGEPGMTLGNAGRTGQMNLGIQGDPNSAATSLNQQSDRWNNLTPAQFQPQSVLDSQALRPSMNAESAQDYARVLLGGYTLPTANGQSQSSWQTSNILKMQGEDSE